MQIKGGPLLQKQLIHNATISNLVPRWQTFEASQFDLQVNTLRVEPCYQAHCRTCYNVLTTVIAADLACCIVLSTNPASSCSFI